MAFQKQPPSCRDCPAYGKSRGFLPPETPPNPTFIFLSSGPSSNECYQGEVFSPHDRDGDTITRWLYRAGLTKSQVALGHLVWCSLERPLKTKAGTTRRDPTQEELVACWQRHSGPWLQQLCQQPGDKHIIALGPVPNRFLRGYTAKQAVDALVGTTEKLTTLPEVKTLDGEASRSE